MLNTVLLRDRITAAGMTQNELAKMMGISKNTLSSIMRGVRPIDTDEIDIICNLLSIEDDEAKKQIFLHHPSQK